MLGILDGPANHVSAVGEHHHGYILVNPAPAEDVAGVAQVVLVSGGVPEDIAPILIAVIENVLGRVITNPVIDPANTDFDGISEGAGAVELHAVDVGNVLQDLGLNVRHLHVVFSARHDTPVNPSPALGADDPVNHWCDFVEHKRHLATVTQHLCVFWIPLEVVVVIRVHCHIEAIRGLLVLLVVVPLQQLPKLCAGLFTIKLMPVRGRKLVALAAGEYLVVALGAVLGPNIKHAPAPVG